LQEGKWALAACAKGLVRVIPPMVAAPRFEPPPGLFPGTAPPPFVLFSLPLTLLYGPAAGRNRPYPGLFPGTVQVHISSPTPNATVRHAAPARPAHRCPRGGCGLWRLDHAGAFAGLKTLS